MKNSDAKNITNGFLEYLKRNNNLDFLPEIIRELQAKVNDLQATATVYSSTNLISEQSERIAKILNTKFGVQNVLFETDESLIGGIKVKIGDQIIDLSLQGKLSQARVSL